MAAQWPQLDPIAQNELLGEITLSVVGALPPGWREVVLDYRVVGKNIDVAVGVLDPNGTYQVWEPSVETWRMFQRLRGGMYQDGEGTWFSARLVIEPPSRFRVQYNWQNEPDFQPYPSPDEFALEQERFPRGEEYMPDWFKRGLAASGAQPQ
ncbi:hypothetical protein SAMN04489729_6201 [Amycolatopsis lurida]|uniref:Uncharacterized protein n=1 Tax=Amycolatopsis lurida NRRL 2430 TaxID=1460371 RepID=A0A2P2G134_AMYLU|nr:hypothetical protein [Amycolatopsis lurida]KFU82688.1 hypothetical protein BB31_03050 [Amycolatopsis lurida NRRL 2430]SEE06041.1 hypothetical protein SAMN04489729_6201 [Amycolatopsis lurida]